MSPVHEVLVEESRARLERVRARSDARSCATTSSSICSIENFDPMGVHTGDSITVAPAQTLTDHEYQRMRDAARRSFAKSASRPAARTCSSPSIPKNGRMVVIEMNPRVSRSSALARKATGFPDREDRGEARGRLSLDEIRQRHHEKTPACFEPTIDYVVVKIPKWQFEKFPGADTHAGHADEVGRRSDGHRPHVQRSAAKGNSLARDRARLGARRRMTPESLLREKLATPTPDRLHWISDAQSSAA